MPPCAVGRIGGVVLAGGRSRRMGRDKADVLLGGRRLIELVCGRLAPQCAAIAISRHDAPDRASDFGHPILPDGSADRAGPIGGVIAALDWSAARYPSATHVATVAVDTPFLPQDLVARLAAAVATGAAPLACATSAGRIHPVAALWPVAMRHDLRAWIGDGAMRRLVAVLERCGFVAVAWPGEPFDPFFNVNTPDDLAAAERIATSNADLLSA